MGRVVVRSGRDRRWLRLLSCTWDATGAEIFGLVRVGVLMAALVGAYVGISQTAGAKLGSSHARHARPLRPVFHRSGTASSIMADRRYVFFEETPPGADTGGTVLDARTGRRSLVSRSGCAPSDLGGPWLVFTCSGAAPQLALYRLATGAWTTITPPGPDSSEMAIGADWIEYLNVVPASGCFDPAKCALLFSYSFQNIQTGQLIETDGGFGTAAWHPGSNSYVDLSSPMLTHPLCPPLQIPTLSAYTQVPTPGTLEFYGDFVVAESSTISRSTGLPFPHRYLERCGTHLHRWLDSSHGSEPVPGPAEIAPANRHTVVWPSGPHRLAGIRLPSLHRFTIAIPNKLGRIRTSRGKVDQVLLTAGSLYVLKGTQLWRAPPP